jgi:hypothetical protein
VNSRQTRSGQAVTVFGSDERQVDVLGATDEIVAVFGDDHAAESGRCACPGVNVRRHRNEERQAAEDQ